MSGPSLAQLDEQQRKWERDLEGARGGNPYATLCLHCCGRHAPPRDKFCPNESIEALKARQGLRND